jgi:hypothetical protein
VNGQFSKGYPQGRASILFYDGSSMEAHFRNGIVDGKVRQFGPDGRLQVADDFHIFESD